MISLSEVESLQVESLLVGADRQYAYALIENGTIIAVSIRYCQLDALPDSLGQLVDLESLDLSGNALTTLPDWIARLSRLKRLMLVGNALTTLPDWIGS